LSRSISAALGKGKEAWVRLDLFPELAQEDLERLIVRRIEQAPHKPTEFSFIGLLQKRLIQVVLKEAGIGEL
jgi:predicted flavoprotein YhiN